MTPELRTKFQEMLQRYFNLKLPDDFIDEILEGNPNIVLELESGGITDTNVRDETIDTILSKLKMRSWPTYGEVRDDNTLNARFNAELATKIHAIGGEYIQ